LPIQKPKKRFSQNFLIDDNIAEAIVEVLEIHPNDTVFEIGAGRGILTRILANSGADIYSFEIDRTLIGDLSQTFRDFPGVKVVNQDFLKVRPNDYFPGPFKLIGNIPYDITSPVLEWMVSNRTKISRAVITAQEELADRISSGPGSKTWAPLSVFCQCHFEVKKVMKIGPKAFFPPPKVTSATLLFKPHQVFSIENWNQFETVVRHSFTHRRKLLTNNLTEPTGLSRTALEEILNRLNLPPTIRAEQISIENFIRLAEELKSINFP
jgi:16S rRNA (adenine1518-N6/adenine1519-N6)-dimethyltransferase